MLANAATRRVSPRLQKAASVLQASLIKKEPTTTTVALQTPKNAKVKKESTDEKVEAKKNNKRKHVDVEYEPSEVKQEVSNKKSKEPPRWLEQWNGIANMRAKTLAPVDTMGCDELYDKLSDPKVKRFHVLVSLMLSSQTKDQVTAAAMQNLRTLPLTVDAILQASDEDIDSRIRQVGFHNRKVIYLKKTALVLKEKYENDIPPTLNELMELPGVGPKMAHLCMQSAWDITEGVGVDVHVHRISNRLGWVKNTSTPEKTRTELESWLPKQNWRPINKLLVGFGQTICLPIGPRCSTCEISNICPSASIRVKKEKSNKRRIVDE